MIKKFMVDYPGVDGFSKRKAYVYLPKSYEKSDKEYPVLYCFDCHNVFYDKDATFGRSWRLGQYLDKNNIDLIVAGIECNKDDMNRMSEYCPFDIQISKKVKCDVHLIEGKGDETFNWYINVLKKMIDEQYRTLKDRQHTYLLGSSMGGIMTTYGILKYNDVFSKGAALSPAYQVGAAKMMEIVKKYQVKEDTTLYTDYGTDDLDVKYAMKQFVKVNDALIKQGVNVTSRIVYKGIHNEASWQKQLPLAIYTLMYDEKIER